MEWLIVELGELIVYSMCRLFELECGIAKGVEFREELRCRERCGGDDMAPLGISGRPESCKKKKDGIDFLTMASQSLC